MVGALRYTSRAAAGSPPPLASEMAAFALEPVDGVLEPTPRPERGHPAGWNPGTGIALYRRLWRGQLLGGDDLSWLGAGRLMICTRRSGRKDPVFR